MQRALVFTLIALLTCLGMVAISRAATSSIEVQFKYDTPAQAFNLYMDGQKICNTNTPNVMSCTDIEIQYGVHLFTMTAVVDGLETMHSPAYVWSHAPAPGDPPVFINFSVTVDGKNVQLAPVNKP